MEHEFDDYYPEPSLADEIIDEALNKLKKIMKNEVKDEWEKINIEKDRLEKSKERLNKDRINLTNRERDLNEKERGISKKEKDFFGMNLKKMKEALRKTAEQSLFRIKRTSIKQDKCNICNENRNIEVMLPDKSTVEVICSCAKSKDKYIIEDIFSLNLNIIVNPNGKERCFSPYIRFTEYDDGYAHYVRKENLFETFESIPDKRKENNSTWDMYFNDKEEAQKYADYLNAKIM